MCIRDSHSAGYLVKVIVSAGSGLLLNVFTDPFLGYFRNVYIFGQEYTVAQALTKIAGGVTFVNSVASTACAVAKEKCRHPAPLKSCGHRRQKCPAPRCPCRTAPAAPV